MRKIGKYIFYILIAIAIGYGVFFLLLKGGNKNIVISKFECSNFQLQYIDKITENNIEGAYFSSLVFVYKKAGRQIEFGSDNRVFSDSIVSSSNPVLLPAQSLSSGT